MYIKCTKCKKEKRPSSFHKDRYNVRNGVKYWCKKCASSYRKKHPDVIHDKEERNKYMRLWQHKNREKVKEYYLKKKFGISLVEYNIKLENQNGVCAICKCICKTGKSLAIDHDHITRKLRGLLCGSCNRAIGFFEENCERLKSAINYLNFYKE